MHATTCTSSVWKESNSNNAFPILVSFTSYVDICQKSSSPGRRTTGATLEHTKCKRTKMSRRQVPRRGHGGPIGNGERHSRAHPDVEAAGRHLGRRTECHLNETGEAALRTKAERSRPAAVRPETHVSNCESLVACSLLGLVYVRWNVNRRGYTTSTSRLRNIRDRRFCGRGSLRYARCGHTDNNDLI
jgi:hypothetical protein